MKDPDMGKMKRMIENELSLTCGAPTVDVSMSSDLIMIRSPEITIRILDMFDNTHRLTVRVLFSNPNIFVCVKERYYLKGTGGEALANIAVKEYIQVSN